VRVAGIVLTAASALGTWSPSAAPGAPSGTPAISASLSAPTVTIGAPLTLSGRATEDGAPAAAVPLELEADGYPFRGFHTIRRAASGADGSFSFAHVELDRDTRLRVLDAADPHVKGRALAVTVDARVQTRSRKLGPGRTRLSVRLWHTRWRRSAPVRVRWFTAPRGARTLRLVAVTLTRELTAGLTYAEAIVEPPARRFSFEVCVNPPWERAMGPLGGHRPCPHESFSMRSHAR
jgi:hypothetical protein